MRWICALALAVACDGGLADAQKKYEERRAAERAAAVAEDRKAERILAAAERCSAHARPEQPVEPLPKVSGKKRAALRNEVLDSIRAGYSVGGGMSSLRVSAGEDAERYESCCRLMYEWKPRIDRIVRQADSLEPKDFDLSAAANTLKLCVWCSSSAPDNCEQVGQYLAAEQERQSARR